jgi:hypothetical protein
VIPKVASEVREDDLGAYKNLSGEGAPSGFSPGSSNGAAELTGGQVNRSCRRSDKSIAPAFCVWGWVVGGEGAGRRFLP